MPDPAKPQAPRAALLRRLFSYTRPYRGTLYLAVAQAIVLAGLAPVRPWLIQQSVDQYIGGKLLHGLVVVSVIQLVMLLAETGLRFWFLYRINWLGQRVVNDLRKSVFDKIIHQRIRYFDNTPIGTLTTRTINDIEAVNDVFGEGIISIVADVLTILAIMGIMFATDPWLALICLTTFPAILIATYFFKESVNKSFQRVRNAVAALNTFVQEHITGMHIVQAFAAEEREMEKFEAINREHRDANIKSIFAYSVFFPVVEIILAISLGLLVWYGARQMLDHDVTQGVIVAFILYLNLLFRPLRMLADKFNVLQMGVIAGERIFGVLDSEEGEGLSSLPPTPSEGGGSRIADPAVIASSQNPRPDTTFPDLSQTSTLIRRRSGGGFVAFQNVYFSYKPGIPVLRGISFEINRGDTLAIVGPTGAGKSSIISLLNRQYDFDTGNILLDGTSIRAFSLPELRRRVGIVLQDVFLFSGTVLENITLRNPEIPEERVAQVCRLLGIHDFILRLPDGYHFSVGERGGALSQGQRQLLSFARALLYDPEILVLDEATASVDSETEIMIQRAIDTLVKGRTSIIIAHRLSTIRKAGQILVLEKGRIAEQGNHAELMALSGKYAGMVRAGQEAEV